MGNLSYWPVMAALACLSAALYRMGGSKDWNTKWRDAGVPACAVAALWLSGLHHWSLVFTYPLMWAALTTYWKVGPKAEWYHWLMHGIGIAVSLIPVIYFTKATLPFVIYVTLMPWLMMTWSVVIDNDVQEELGRGFLIVALIPVFKFIQ